MVRWILLNRHLVHIGWFTLGSTGLVVMTFINVFLLRRLVESDFLRPPKSLSSEKPVHLNGNGVAHANGSNGGHKRSD
jgi:hypothetical protein